jgi:hypothetical protein
LSSLRNIKKGCPIEGQPFLHVVKSFDVNENTGIPVDSQIDISNIIHLNHVIFTDQDSFLLNIL